MSVDQRASQLERKERVLHPNPQGRLVNLHCPSPTVSLGPYYPRRIREPVSLMVVDAESKTKAAEFHGPSQSLWTISGVRAEAVASAKVLWPFGGPPFSQCSTFSGNSELIFRSNP